MLSNVPVNEGQPTEFLCQTEEGVLESTTESDVRLFREVQTQEGWTLSNAGITRILLAHNYTFRVTDPNPNEVFVCALFSAAANYTSQNTEVQLFSKLSININIKQISNIWC